MSAAPTVPPIDFRILGPLSVTVDGQPSFDDPPPLFMDGIEMSVRSGDITCTAADDLGAGDSNSDL